MMNSLADPSGKATIKNHAWLSVIFSTSQAGDLPLSRINLKGNSKKHCSRYRVTCLHIFVSRYYGHRIIHTSHHQKNILGNPTYVDHRMGVLYKKGGWDYEPIYIYTVWWLTYPSEKYGSQLG